MRAALVAALGEQAALVFASDGDSVAAIRLANRDHGMILLVVEPDLAPLDRAMVLAAVGPLATELAPATRIAALDVGAGADSHDVTAAAQFLVSAHSTTGQVVRITSRG